MIWLLLGVVALVAMLAAGSRLSQVDPRILAQGLRFADRKSTRLNSSHT